MTMTASQKGKATSRAYDKEVKKKLLVDTIVSHCSESSDFEEFREIAHALKQGGNLNAKVISGGETNYSYKVYLEGSSTPLSTVLYAKIAFPYALWNPESVHYDVARAENEFKIMKRFAELMGDNAPVATPYLCVDVDEMKIVVTEWASADEQWANQFIDGQVDKRIISKLAEALATLNLAPFDDEFDLTFNDNVRPCMRSLFTSIKSLFAEHIVGYDTMDSCEAYMKRMGQGKFDMLVDNLEKQYMTRECINHSDPHVFNLLVEPKPDGATEETFGDRGDFVICDWEMAMAGPHGRDAGIFQAYPISCALIHAAQGRREIAYDLLGCCIQFWDEFATILVERGAKDEAFLTKTFRSSMGWTAMYLFFVNYLMVIHNEFWPTEGLTEDLRVKARSAVGHSGLKFLEYGCGNKEPNLSLDGLRAHFKDIIGSEIELLLAAASGCLERPRRGSSLRQSRRRVSDAIVWEEAARRASSVTFCRRNSMDKDPIGIPLVPIEGKRMSSSSDLPYELVWGALVRSPTRLSS